MCAEFASMDGDNQNIPFNGSSTNENALGLTNPDSVLTGTNRGQQALGAPNIKTDSANQRIVVNDNTTNRVSFGKIGTGVNDWGLKVSQPTINVDTATNSQLIFNSSQNVFKIVASSSVTQTLTNAAGTVAAGTQTFTIAHNLGFSPVFMVYMTTPITYTDGSLLIALPELSVLPAGNPLGGGTIFNKFYGTVDTTNLYIKYFHRVNTDYSPSLPTFIVRYYLLQETSS